MTCQSSPAVCRGTSAPPHFEVADRVMTSATCKTGPLANKSKQLTFPSRIFVILTKVNLKLPAKLIYHLDSTIVLEGRL